MQSTTHAALTPICRALIPFLAIAVSAIAEDVSPEQNDDELTCGTIVSESAVEAVLRNEFEGAYAPSVATTIPTTTKFVPVAFHVVRRSDGSGGMSASDLCNTWVNLQTSGVGGSDFELFLVGPIEYIDDDYFFEEVDSFEAADVLRQHNPRCDAINIYLVKDLFNFGAQGIASFTFSPYQGILVIHGSAPYSTTPHEVGHYFDLFHTHETAFGAECVDGSNCSTAGDLLCDTPADPRLGSDNVNFQCAYTGNETDSCNADSYAPDVTNYMSYSRRHCRTTWTSGQVSRAFATLTNLRPELIHNSPPTNRLPGQMDDCNNNGVHDGCDIISGMETDWNGNGTLDSCDLLAGTSDDINGNDIPDESERLYVDANANGAQTGLSWADAFSDLQDALALARRSAATTEIWVAAGMYTPGPAPSGPSDWQARSATFALPCGGKIFGGFAGNETSRDQRDPAGNTTILSGDLAGDDATNGNAENAYSIVNASDTNRSATLDGFTISGGNADTFGICDCDRGAGIRMGGNGDGGSLRIVDCIIRDNVATFGGGIWLGGDSFPEFIGCTFLNNSATDSGGAVWSQSNNTPTFVNSHFRGNHADFFGGAILHANTDTSFTGGAVNSPRRFVALNSTFAGNTAGVDGGALRTWSAEPMLINCDLVANVAGGSGGGIAAGCGGCTQGVELSVFNSILWANEDSTGTGTAAQLHVVAGDVGTVLVEYSTVHDAAPNDGTVYAGTGNQDEYPDFLDDPDNGGDGWGNANDNFGDLRLTINSACEDTGSNGALPIDGWDFDGDLDREEAISVDAILAPRIQNGIVDMGAYEGTFVDTTPIRITENSDFESQSLDPWDWNAGSNPGRPVPQFSIEDIDGATNALRIFRATDNDGSHGVARQNYSLRVVPGATITASLDVRIATHNFGGFNSWNAYPANLWVRYRDAVGGNYSFRRSFYEIASPGHSPDAFPVAEQLTANTWVQRTFDLSNLTPPIAEITQVQIGAQGWSYDVAFDNVALDVVGLDCNGNGVADHVDIGNGTSPDANGDGLPDECQQLIGDLNCDGVVSVADIGPFVLALTDATDYAAQFPDCDIQLADVNGDGVVSVGDIGAFVLLVTGAA